MRGTLGVVMAGLLACGGARAEEVASAVVAVLTPANLASLAHNKVAHLEAEGAARAAGQDVTALGGVAVDIGAVGLSGDHKCRAVYFTRGHEIVGDWKPCALTPDKEGTALTVPGLFAGHLLADGRRQMVFYGVRLAEGGGIAPRYGFSPARDVAGYFYALGGGRFRLEIEAEVGKFEVVEIE